MGVCAHLKGGVAEWLKAAVLKTVERLRVPGVRIPPPPPEIRKKPSGNCGFFAFQGFSGTRSGTPMTFGS